MSDDNTMNLTSLGDFLRDLVMSGLGITRPGPSDDAIASLEDAMGRGRLKLLPTGRKVAFKMPERRWLREAHRAGAVDWTELSEVTRGIFPCSAIQWPASDLVLELRDPPEKQTRTLIRVQVRDGNRHPLRMSAFINQMDAGSGRPSSRS